MLKSLIVATLLALTAVAATPSAPKLSYDEATKQFTATFDKGAEWACLAYASTTETIEQEGKTVPYVFHFCGPLNPTGNRIVTGWNGANCYASSPDEEACYSGTDWNIQLTVQYPVENPGQATTMIDADSNIVTVKH